jgi:hypothetical protein
LLNDEKKAALLTEIQFMEKEILYFKGRMRRKARKAYHKLLKSSIDILELNNPIYLMRYE